MPSESYYIDVRHDGLNAFRRVCGRDRFVVQQKASAQLAAWNSKWEKLQGRASMLRSKEEKREEASRRTFEAQEAIQSIDKTLISHLEASSAIEWELLKSNSEFPAPKPEAPASKSIPPQPLFSDAKYQAPLGFLDHILSWRRKKKEYAARGSYEFDLRAWKETKTKIEHENESSLSAFTERLRRWELERGEFKAERARNNASVDERRQAYFSKSPDAVLDYCDMVLAASPYPDNFPKSFRLNYNTDTGLLLVDYSLPYVDSLPRLKEVRYTASKDEFTELFLPDSVLEKLYDGLLYKVALRSLQELFEADVVGAIGSIVFNGWVEAIDKATGQVTNGCILSIQVNRQEYLAINLAQVDPKACFKKLKGIGSSKLAALVPIRPILQLNTEDERFVPSHEVADTLDDSVNLAAMDWEEFEHLIREVFENEFNKDGAEVKITRTSRDGGVDAVVFDPDPLRGGKIVVQAKRYTNTVGVSAVRDLYGTVVNEGATKGILVTTADYGPDAYNFAKDKPLTLLNGNNLLHLLGKHGHRAKIDLKEAKLLLKASGHRSSDALFTY